MKMQADERHAPPYLYGKEAWTYDYRRPSVACTVVLFDAKGNVLVGRRKGGPHEGAWSLPGGFLNATEETVQECARRELAEETGLVGGRYLQLLCVSSNPMMDPRGHVVNVCFVGTAKGVKPEVVSGDDLAEVSWRDPEWLASEYMAFDHHDIMTRGQEKWMAARWWRHLW